MESGRVKPLDSVARNALLAIHGKPMLRLANGKTLGAAHWLAEMFFDVNAADRYPVFTVHNAEVRRLLGHEEDARQSFSYADLTPYRGIIDQQARLGLAIAPSRRSAYERAVLHLRDAMLIYRELRQSLGMVPVADGDGVAWLSLG